MLIFPKCALKLESIRLLVKSLYFPSLIWVASRGFWTETLGIGDFYFQLAVQIIEICFSSREENGGLIDSAVLLSRLDRLRGSKSAKISL